MPVADTQVHKRLPTPIFALTIGINDYQYEEYPDLDAAVGDANKFEQFLKGSLGVPERNIISLRDEKATREGIIGGFESLAANPLIQREDAIVIFYSGHGANTEMPAHWIEAGWVSGENHIEMLCPSDIGTGNPVVPGIPDRTIASLLNIISNAKGDNITLILDCCHSAGINRSDIPDGLVPRSILHPPPIPADCDHDIHQAAPRAGNLAQGFSGQNRASHVLLAACGRAQQAYECPKSKEGLFTRELLRVLKVTDVDKLTYISLMHKLEDLRIQTPHCDGANVQRRLFNKRDTGADHAFILGWRDDTRGIFLSAGEAQGIQQFAKFAIYRTDIMSESNEQLGTFIVKETKEFTSVLGFEKSHTSGSTRFEVPTQFYAKQIFLGPYHLFFVYCEDTAWLENIVSKASRIVEDNLGFVEVDDTAYADLTIIPEQGGVVFERKDDLINSHIGARLQHKLPLPTGDGGDDGKEKEQAEDVLRVIYAARNFAYHLHRKGSQNVAIRMELHDLESKFDMENIQWIRVPKGENLISKDPSYVRVTQVGNLGITIHNGTDVPLYPNVLYFDASDLAIQAWSLPAFGSDGEAKSNGSGRIDPPLLPHSKLTLGYGAGGASPWRFHLRKDEEKDLGFFKVFYASAPADFKSLAQPSPFRIDPSSRTPPNHPPQKYPDIWGELRVGVVQIR